MEETNTTDLSLNYTHDGKWSNAGNFKLKCIYASGGLMILFCVLMVICVFGMVGNGIVLWFLGFQMKQNHFTIYILNLAVADCSLLLLIFLVILGILSFKLICYDLHYTDTLFDYFVFIIRLLCNFFVLSSLGLLTAISTERCVSVIFPIWYRCHRPKHLSGIVSGVAWATVGLFILSYYVCSRFDERYYRQFGIVGIVYSMIFSLIMLISNVSVVPRLRCGSHRRHLGKLYVAVVLNIIFFFALGMPYTVNASLNLLYYGFLFPETVTLVLALLNSSINPVIYFLVGSCRQRCFQGSIQVALRRVFEEKERSKEESLVPEGIPMESNAQDPAEEAEA